MYHQLGKSLVVVISGLSLLGLSAYLQAEEAKAGAAQPAPQQSAEQPATATTGKTVPAAGQPQGYYPPNRQSARPVVWPDQAARNNPPPPQQLQQQRPQPQQPQYRPRQQPQAAPSYGPPRGYYPPSRAQQPVPTGPQPGGYGAYGPQAGPAPGGYAPAPGYYPGGYGSYGRPYPYRRSKSNNWMPWSGDWSSDDMFPWSSNSGRKKNRMPWQGWGKDSQPWNKDKEWDKMPWNWNLDNNPMNNWSGDGRMKDGSKYYDKGRTKKKANVTWD